MSAHTKHSRYMLVLIDSIKRVCRYSQAAKYISGHLCKTFDSAKAKMFPNKTQLMIIFCRLIRFWRIFPFLLDNDKQILIHLKGGNKGEILAYSLFRIIMVSLYKDILKNASDSILYLNGLLSFMAHHPPQKYQVVDTNSFADHIRLLLPCAMYLGIFLGSAGFAYLLHWTKPCKASLIGYWIIPECHQKSLVSTDVNFAVKISILFANH